MKSVLAIVLILFPSLSTVGQVLPDDQHAVEALIRDVVGSGRSPDGQTVVEYQKARRVIVGTGPNPTTEWLVAQFQIDTGNSWQAYIAIWDRNGYRRLGLARAGGKDYREVTVKGVANGVIKADTMYYGPADALCCPSVPGSTSFHIEGDSLWESGSRVATSPKVPSKLRR